MGRTPFDIADIVRLHQEALEVVQPLSSEQGRALSAITLCRTAALGGHVNYCFECGWSSRTGPRISATTPTPTSWSPPAA